MAGAVLVGLFAFNALKLIASEALAAAARANPAPGGSDPTLVLNVLYVFGAVVHAAGAAAVARCVALSQRAAPAEPGA